MKARGRRELVCRRPFFSSWEGMSAGAWRSFSSPWRPSRGDLEAYSSLLPSRISRVLVLGSTPELRRLALSRGAAVDCVESSPAMAGLSRRLLPLRRGKERFFISDWLNYSPGPARYGAVLADLSLRLLPAAARRRLFSLLAPAISPGGVMVTRVHFPDPAFRGMEPAEIFFVSAGPILKKGGSPAFAAGAIRSRIMDSGRWKPGDGLPGLDLPLPEGERRTARILEEQLRSVAPYFGQGEEGLASERSGSFSEAGRLNAGDYPDAAFYPVLALAPLGRRP